MNDDYIKPTDIHKLSSSIELIKHYEKIRNQDVQEIINSESLREPEKFNVFGNVAEHIVPIMEQLAKDRNISVESLVFSYSKIVNELFVNEGFHDLLMDLVMQIILKNATHFAKFDSNVKAQHANYEKQCKHVADHNRKLIDNAKNRVSSYKVRLKQENELLEIRINKFIRSMNKALERAGNPKNLSPNDYYVYKQLEKRGFVGFDGSRYCCIELEIKLNRDSFLDFIYNSALNNFN